MSGTPGEGARAIVDTLLAKGLDLLVPEYEMVAAAIQPYLEDIATLRADMNVIMEDCANLTEALEVAREGVTNIRNTPCKCWSGLQTTADVVLQGIAALVGQPESTHTAWCGKPSTMCPNETAWCKEHQPAAQPGRTE